MFVKLFKRSSPELQTHEPSGAGEPAGATRKHRVYGQTDLRVVSGNVTPPLEDSGSTKQITGSQKRDHRSALGQNYRESDTLVTWRHSGTFVDKVGNDF